MKKIVSTIVISFIITACGDGGGDNSSTNKNLKTTSISSGKVELGPISGGSVIIQSLDGHEFTNYTTDNNGNYTINTKELKEAIDRYNPSIKFVRIISHGGVDTDVNDDKTYKQKLVQGSISGIVPVDKLFSDKKQSINLISTAIDKLLEGTLNISEEQIIKIAKELKVTDINKDGNITIDDILYYKMSKNESIAEERLREYLLPTIHNNNQTEQKNVIENMRYEYSTIVPKTEVSSGVAKISFETLKNNYIQFGIKKDSSDVKFQQYYSGNSINLNTNEVLFFQQCNITASNCSKMQKVYFDGREISLDYLNVEKLDLYKKIAEYKTKRKKLLEELKALREKKNSN